MADGSLHQANLHTDVKTFQGKDSAAASLHGGVGGGFPCQAMDQTQFVACSPPSFCLSEGVSIAGAQRGLGDQRTSLVSHCFRIYDDMSGLGPKALI